MQSTTYSYLTYRYINSFLQESPVEESFQFDFSQGRLWEKRDSEKMIRENKASLKLLPDCEIDSLLADSNNMMDDEIHGHNTKPCFSIVDFLSAQDNEDDFPSLTLHRSLSVDTQKGDIIENEEEHIIANDNSEDSAVVLADAIVPLTTVVTPKVKLSTINKEDDEEFTNSILEISKKTEESKNTDDNDFEWNNFLVRRACFRGISVYYKSKFSKINTSWQRKRVNKKKKTPMHVLIKDFARSEFGSTVDSLPEEQWVSFRNTLYSILFSHRYKKQDDFLDGVDFTLIRGVLYSYTTEARVELMSNPFFSLVVLNFLEKGKTKFLKSKVENKPKAYSDEIKAELEALSEEAKEYTKDLSLFDN